MKNHNKTIVLTKVLFIIYLIALLWILLFKLGVHFSYMGISRSVNLIPFNEVFIQNSKIDFGGMIMNVVIFVPLGMYSGLLNERWVFGRNLFLFFLTSLTIEGFQFIFALGTFDVTDIINNTLGGIIGLLIFKGIEKVFNNRVKVQKFINLIATIGTVLMILFLFLLKTNRLGLRYQ